MPKGEWLYAVGDINGRSPLTHMGKYQARVCGDVIAARAESRGLRGPRYTASADNGQVPQVVFTSPEIAWVGRTEKKARDDGYDVEVVEIELAVAGSSLLRDDYSGRAKLVIDKATDVILGATFAGPRSIRAGACGDNRGRRRRTTGNSLACGALVSDGQ